MSFLIAKQPIFNKEGRRVAFEVFLRRSDNINEYPREVPYSRATYIIIEIILEQGLERVGEGKKVMINVSLDSLINKAIESLDPKKLIIEIIEPQVPIGEVVFKQIVNAMDRFTQQGVMFCIDEKNLANDKISSLLSKVHILSVDWKRLNQKVIDLARKNGKTLLISRIENEEDHKKALSTGDLFQGHFLEKPFVLKEFHTAPYLKNTLLKLIAVVHSAQSPREIASHIVTDVGMSAKVLRLVNSAFYSTVREINSVEQACAIMGLKALKNFLLVLAMNDYVSIENPGLWKKSLKRAIIAQKIAEIINPKYENEAYMMGLFSLIDEILYVDKISFLKEVKVKQEIIDAFTGDNLELKSILDAATIMEENSQKVLSPDSYMDEETLIHLETLTGIDRYSLISIIKLAHEMTEQIIKV